MFLKLDHHQPSLLLLRIMLKLLVQECQLKREKKMIAVHTVILPDRTIKNGASLILPSSIARNSSAPNAKRIFEIL